MRLAGLMSRWTMPLSSSALQAQRRLTDDFTRQSQRRPTVPRQEPRDIETINELHDQIPHPLHLGGIVRDDDVRMDQAGGVAQFRAWKRAQADGSFISRGEMIFRATMRSMTRC